MRDGPLRGAFRLVSSRPRPWLVHLAASLFANACGLLPAFLTRAFFDLVSGNAPAGLTLWSIVALMASLYVGNALAVLGRAVSGAAFLAGATASLHGALFRSVLRKPGAAAIADSPGEAVSRFQGDAFDSTAFALWLVDCVGSLAWSAVSVTIMLRISALVTIASLSPLLVIGLTAGLAASRVRVYRRAAREAAGNVTGFIAELFGAVQAVQAFTAQRTVVKQFAALNDTRRRAALRDRLFGELLSSVYGNIVNLGAGIVLLLAAGLIRDGSFTVGNFALFVSLLEGVGWTASYAGIFPSRLRQAAVSRERTNRLADTESAGQGDPAGDAGPLQRLEVEGLTCIHASTGGGIADASFTLERGTITVVAGKIGAGKTTLLRALLGLLPSSRGTILWNGNAVRSPQEFFVPPRSSYTPQVPRLFSGSLRDNIAMGREAPAGGLDRALRAAVLEDDLAHMDSGWDTRVGARGVLLSGGQVQRVAAARMFFGAAELLVMDDVSSALDVETEQRLWERLLLRETGTCLVVSHRPWLLERADRILLVLDGRIVDAGRLDELSARSPEIRSLLRPGSA